MAGHSSRRGAVRKTSGGNPTAGSGGRVRRGLEGRGPTPKAEEREGHKAYRARQRAQQEAQRSKDDQRSGQSLQPQNALEVPGRQSGDHPTRPGGVPIP